MGIPQHFSLELPQRCLHLIDELWQYASEINRPGEEWLGSLTTTFLLAMATPIINLPVERISKHIGLDDEGYADDRALNAELMKEAQAHLGNNHFSESPFFESGTWSYAQRDPENFNIARHFPDDLAVELATAQAFAKAEIILANQWISCLRNALAHGGIAYLNANGCPALSEPVEMYAFVSGKYEFDDDGNRVLARINILRISEDGFRNFLRKWVTWLKSAGLVQELVA